MKENLVTIARRIRGASTAVLLLLGTGMAFPAQPAARAETAHPSQPQSEAVQSANQPHAELAYHLSPGKLTQAIALNKIRVMLDMGGSLWGLMVLGGLLAFGLAAKLEQWALETTTRRWLQGTLFFAAIIVILGMASLPLDAFGHAASRRYGISVQAWSGWLGDQGKGLGVSLLTGVPLALLGNRIVRVSPRRYWLWLWMISIPLIVGSVFLAPLVLDPLFNKFEPLKATHPELVSKLEEVVERTGTAIPPDRMFLMKASEKTNGINAYVTGIGASKRFVMWDTTTDRMPDDEIMFIFGHESGHYVLNHIPKMLAALIAGLLIVFWACAQLEESMVRRFGERWKIGPIAGRTGFLALIFTFSIAGFVATPIGNAVSRHYEHEADIYGQEAIHGLVPDSQKTAVSSFNHLGEAWLDDPNPSAFVEFWSYSHPSVQERAEFAEHYDPWTNGGHGRFF